MFVYTVIGYKNYRKEICTTVFGTFVCVEKAKQKAIDLVSRGGEIPKRLTDDTSFDSDGCIKWEWYVMTPNDWDTIDVYNYTEQDGVAGTKEIVSYTAGCGYDTMIYSVVENVLSD